MPMLRNTASVPSSQVSRYEKHVTLHTYPPMKMGQTECFETLAFKLQMLVNHPKESIQLDMKLDVKLQFIYKWIPIELCN
jgi:hypothetical protein